MQPFIKSDYLYARIMKGYMYILKCANGYFYTGSTKYLDLRIQQHQSGEGSNYTKKHLPVELVYYEEFNRIDEAFFREKQVQGWSRNKKEALIDGKFEKLPSFAECKNESHFKNRLEASAFDSAQATSKSSLSEVETNGIEIELKEDKGHKQNNI